jgi:hypothetical protein
LPPCHFATPIQCGKNKEKEGEMKQTDSNSPVATEVVTVARSGVVAAGDPETAAAGADMLKQGGNAVDAAVAAAFASFIAEIGVVHWGGSGLAHIYDGRNGRSPAGRGIVGRGIVYDFFSDMPGRDGSPPDRLDFEEVMIDFGATTQSFHLGRASVAVPACANWRPTTAVYPSAPCSSPPCAWPARGCT